MFVIERKLCKNSNDSDCRAVAAKKSKYLRNRSFTEATNMHIPKMIFDEKRKCKVTCIVSPPTRRLFDPDNFQPTLKPIMDGLTDARIWSDDNYNVVTSTTYKYSGERSGVDKSYKFKIVIELCE